MAGACTGILAKLYIKRSEVCNSPVLGQINHHSSFILSIAENSTRSISPSIQRARIYQDALGVALRELHYEAAEEHSGMVSKKRSKAAAWLPLWGGSRIDSEYLDDIRRLEFIQHTATVDSGT
jgi:hypothetical protein